MVIVYFHIFLIYLFRCLFSDNLYTTQEREEFKFCVQYPWVISWVLHKTEKKFRIILLLKTDIATEIYVRFPRFYSNSFVFQ